MGVRKKVSPNELLVPLSVQKQKYKGNTKKSKGKLFLF